MYCTEYKWIISYGTNISDYMMTSSNGSIFHIIGLLCREFTGHRRISLTKASDPELWCFLWCEPELTQCRRRWYQMPSCSLWHRCNGIYACMHLIVSQSQVTRITPYRMVINCVFQSLLPSLSSALLFGIDYRKIHNISHTKSPNLNVSRLVLQLPLPNPMKPGVKSRMKM